MNFAVVGSGAPPPPVSGGFYFNTGVAPGIAPPGWYGPPPVGGWSGPPPAGGWNTPWVGPVVALAVAQATFAPFTYNTFTALPVFNWQFGGWGYWYFGVWVPLYV